MASLYSRPGSAFFWLKFRDRRGKVKQISTRCRIGVAPEVRRARQMEAEKTLAEFSSRSDYDQNSQWGAWVDDFLATTYGASRTGTLERYKDCWRSLSMFLEEHSLTVPSQLTRSHCLKYIAWRCRPNLRKGKYRAGHNTALLDLKILRIIMQEALERNWCQGNPCVKLKIKRAPAKVKPEFDASHVQFIRQKMSEVTDPERRAFLEVSFEIAHYQGCRISETCLDPLTAVDLDQRRITFHAKGDKQHTTLLHPQLVPLFERLRKEGCRHTWNRPEGAGRQWASSIWFRFLRNSGLKTQLPGACFHSTRVSVATNMARNEVPENLAQAYLGHASTTVHRIYIKLKPEDLSACAKAIV